MNRPLPTGQLGVLRTHYARTGAAPVAYLDETYHLDFDGRRRFYVMAAVVVLELDRDPLRTDLDRLVPTGWWHTTDELGSHDGRDRTRTLLQTFQVPDETCVIVDKIAVDPSDRDGSLAREAVLGRLLTAVHTAEHGTHPPVHLAVIEEQREARKNNFDRAIRTRLITAGAIAARMQLVAVSPGSEHLLWLPDLVCSAYRQKTVFGKDDLFVEIEHLTHVVQLPRESANPRLP
jgi:hypothetical protein